MTNKKPPSKGLGRGLDALLGETRKPVSVKTGDKQAGDKQASSGKLMSDRQQELPIEFIIPNADQPRKVFSDEAIGELANSITEKGVLQPILVRPVGAQTYEIVAGERRWRAAQRAKLHSVPVVIRKLTDDDAAEIALIENVQRVDLNPIEEARAYQFLADKYKRTQDQIAKAVGKSRPHVSNMMRLLGLPTKALDALSEGLITMGHARALVGHDNANALCSLVIDKGLSVRATEKMVRTYEDEKKRSIESGDAKNTPVKSSVQKANKDADTKALERDLAATLGLEVNIDHTKKGAGTVSVSYLDLDQLDDVVRRLMGTPI